MKTTFATEVTVTEEEASAIERLATANNFATPEEYIAHVIRNAAASWAAQLRTPEMQMQLQLQAKDRELDELRAERAALVSEKEARVSEALQGEKV